MDTLATPTYTRHRPGQADAASVVADPTRARSNDAAATDRVETDAGHFTLSVNRRYVRSGTLQFPVYKVAGVPFRMAVEGNEIVLSHEYLPLRGRGAKLLEAEQDLIENAKSQMPLEWKADLDRLELRDFILKVL